MKNIIKSLLLKKISLEKIYIKGDDYHLIIVAIGKIFFNMNEKERQQVIYSPLKKLITNNKIHALTIETYTLKEWKKYKENNKF
ncbi:BolA/IbaG family iron-sulfur metabolism protein [Buchnera aphidicola]|uniref:BolA/IbaG family iron-sulfur metabolism protein n=1 Tax=Buchnera aphidicola TaxID=9 RepID=UPI0031B7314B